MGPAFADPSFIMEQHGLVMQLRNAAQLVTIALNRSGLS